MKRFRVTVNGETFEVEVEEIGQGEVPEVRPAQVASAPLQQPAAPKLETPKAKPASASPGAGERVASPLPGTILEVKVQVGQKVSEGDLLMVLEAMKMENEIVATASGVVQEIPVNKGQTVSTGDVLAVIG